MDKNYSFHIGTSGKLTYNAEAEYNKAGAILFTKDTNELFININDVSPTTKDYRKQINSLYSTAVKGQDDNNNTLIFDAKKLNEMYNNVISQSSTLNNKMDKNNPVGTGNFIFGSENTLTTNSENSMILGQNLLQGENSSNSITSGRFNVKLDNALLTIGSGTDNNNRRNAFAVISSNTTDYGIFANDLYIKTGGNNFTSPNEDYKVLTKKDVEDKISKVETDLTTKINNLSPSPFLSSATQPDLNSTLSEEELKKIHSLFWINTSKGNGVLNYWKPNTVGDGGSWIEVSAIFT